MPANREELTEFINAYEDDWTKRDSKNAAICGTFGDVIFYGPNYSRAVWEHVQDWIVTNDHYWYEMAVAARERVLERRKAASEDEEDV